MHNYYYSKLNIKTNNGNRLFVLNQVFTESVRSIYNRKLPVIIVPKRDVLMKIPFLCVQSFRMKRMLNSVIGHFYFYYFRLFKISLNSKIASHFHLLLLLFISILADSVLPHT